MILVDYLDDDAPDDGRLPLFDPDIFEAIHCCGGDEARACRYFAIQEDVSCGDVIEAEDEEDADRQLQEGAHAIDVMRMSAALAIPRAVRRTYYSRLLGTPWSVHRGRSVHVDRSKLYDADMVGGRIGGLAAMS